MTIQQILLTSSGQSSGQDSGLITSRSDFITYTSNGNTYDFLGSSGSTYSIPVVNDPNSNKSIRFPTSWPATSFLQNYQDQTISFTPLSTENFNILNDIIYIFQSGLLGIGLVSGSSEGNYDFWSLWFNGTSIFNAIEIFRYSGSATNSYIAVTSTSYNTPMTNSAFVRYTTDVSVNGGSGLFAGSGFLYFG